MSEGVFSCIIRTMQFLIDRSKYLVLAVLSCSLVVALLVGFPQITSEGFVTNTEDGYSVKPAESIWSSLGRELNLDHKAQSSQVQKEIRKLLADQDELYRILKAAGPYIYYIHKQVQARGLPAELALIPVIESEFNPNDHSNKGATGLWQLMPGTAHELGIKANSSYDGRRNVVASTKAALAYFKDLGNEFNHNWYLAIAAYNCGQVRVESAERRTGSQNFWNLPLPQETKYYVPKLLAVAEIVKNPEKYGVRLPNINNEPYFAEVQVKKSVNLNQVAKSSGISVATLHALNPDYRQDVVPTKGALLVPVKKVPVVKEKFADGIVPPPSTKQTRNT